MLSKIEESPDPHVHGRPVRVEVPLIFLPIVELRDQYVDATPAIREVIEETIRHTPRVLIDTKTGRLYDKTRQPAAFETLPVYDELRSSMTTELDPERIQKEVKDFYHYVMFSHRWDHEEPLCL